MNKTKCYCFGKGEKSVFSVGHSIISLCRDIFEGDQMGRWYGQMNGYFLGCLFAVQHQFTLFLVLSFGDSFRDTLLEGST